ncbi:Iota toxin protein Ib (plasmid) [Bacillus mycoides]|uniref:binary toxin-like calcium binding domain-containing protein n=1 Tax=Bacillus mycoides TaxID=1405 RepID=UPI001C030AA7|nr:binary toxin-like calcium binding domain-containing protein [Bacillus mycoides]QWH64093.1 Iota toxin protein Ib [Bacillus mycoides]
MQNIVSSKVDQATVIGLVGFYFKDTAFKDLMFIQVGEKSNLMDKSRINTVSQQSHSVRWMGNLIPPQTGEYKLSTSFNNNVIMQINGETVINQSSIEKSLQLEKDKVYEIKIEYRDTSDTLSDLQLFWSIGAANREQIPEKYILSPNFSEKENVLAGKEATPFFPEYNLFDRQQENGQKQSISAPIDSDNDGIPDEWEEKGYTFKDNQIVAWNDSFSALGYKKYVSNPRKARTAADPYTDFEKVTGHMPEATKDEARDPLVAAYPAVGVGMEKLHFSKNDNVSEGTGGTVSKTVTKTDTTTNTVEGGGSVGWDGEKGFSLSFSAKYSHSWSNSTARADTESTSWSTQIGINTAERAYLNANVRYYNGGTAPIYDLRPTSNFVLQNSGNSIATITAGPNQIGNSLGPGATYPAKGLAPISLDKANEAGTMKISVDAPTLDKLQSGVETLDLETTQNKGQFGKIDEQGNPVPGGEWDPIRTNIDSISGVLILNLGTGKDSLERRVTARNMNDPEDKTPEITIKEAIEKAFNAKEKDGRLYYTDQDGKNIFIDEPAINLIGDQNTKKEIENQLSQMPGKKIYDAKWKRGMKITLHVPTSYSDFETGSSNPTWYHISYGSDGGNSGKRYGIMETRGWASLPELKPYTSYTARAYARTASATGSNDVNFFVGNEAGGGQGVSIKGKLTGDKWKLVELSFNTVANPEYFRSIGFINEGNADLHFDDVSVTEWKPTEDIKKGHGLGKCKYSASIPLIDGITFPRIPSTKVRYQLEIDGKMTDIRSDAVIDASGTRYVNFHKFNNGNGIDMYKRIIVFAVDEKNDNLKAKLNVYSEFEYESMDTGYVGNNRYINGITFGKVPLENFKYQLYVNGNWTSILYGDAKPNGKMYINFLAFNNGRGYHIVNGFTIQIFTVNINDNNKKTYLATLSFERGNFIYS